MKTLIVDDLPENRMFLNSILSPFGPCDMAGNGEEAIRFVEESMDEQEPYDLILLDIMMPKMNGLDALQKIRSMEEACGVVGTREAVIIMVTADDSPFSALNAYFKGYCTDYLTKPVTRSILLDKLKEYHLP